jgi:hypothetical protein
MLCLKRQLAFWEGVFTFFVFETVCIGVFGMGRGGFECIYLFIYILIFICIYILIFICIYLPCPGTAS